MERISASKSGNDPSNWKGFTGSSLAKDANGNLINGTPLANNSIIISGVGGGGGSSSGNNSGGDDTDNDTDDGNGDIGDEDDTEEQGDDVIPGTVVINEIAWMGTATSSFDEWIELYNTSSQSINLNNWTLKSTASPSFDPDIILSGIIPANSYFLLERTDDTTISDITADQIYVGGLNNKGESLELKDIVGELIDSVDGSAGWLGGDNDTKSSMERINSEELGDNSSNWSTNDGVIKNGLDAAGDPINGTPKAENSQLSTLTTSEVVSPQAVTDLFAAHASPTITATWTAPNPGGHNTASLSYDLRYSTISFNDAASASWWDAATQVASSSLPSVAEEGTPQTATFQTVYQYGQTLYLALKVVHITMFNIVSPQSNIAEVSFLSAVDDGAWAMFGKDQYHTSFAGTVSGPGPTATISWEFDDLDPGYAISQLVADADGNIYFGAANGSSGKIGKLDKNGEEPWKEPYETNVSIGVPAVLADGTVYFGRIGAGGAQSFTALNSDGSKKWDYDGSGKVQSVTVSSKGEPHFSFDLGELAVLNPDGTEKVNINNSEAGGSPVVLDDGTIITAARSGNHFFTAFASSGSQLWQIYTSESFGDPLSDPSHDKSTGKTYSAAGRKLFEVSYSESEPVINDYNITPWGYLAATTVAITPDTLYIGFNGINPASGSLLYALNKSDLSEKWSSPFPADGYINDQLVVDKNQNIYFSTQNGKLYGVNNLGSQLWPSIDSGSNSTISPVLTKHGLVWSYGNKIVLVE